MIKVGDFKLGLEEKKAINEVLDSGRLSEGPKVALFEKKWADFIDTNYCVLTSSGTGALITALTALKYYYDLPLGTQVITTPLTYIADASAISVVGFEPVFIDVDPKTFVILPDEITKALRKSKNHKKIRVILPVDLMGFPVEIDKINKIAKENNLLVLEDAAQAHGSIFKGKKCGSQANLSVFSFYIAHNIQAGEMGAVNTNSEPLMKLSMKIKAQGRTCDCRVCTREKGICPMFLKFKNKKGDYDPRFTHDLIGYNFKTMEFQAALALTQIKKIKEIILKRQNNVSYLNKKLGKYDKILQLPVFSRDISYLAYPLIIKKPKLINRKKLRSQLNGFGIESRPLFGSIPTQQPAYEFLKDKYQGKIPQADYLGENGFYIGCHQYLTKQDLETVVDAFNKILG